MAPEGEVIPCAAGAQRKKKGGRKR